jgi:hypothetical protein
MRQGIRLPFLTLPALQALCGLDFRQLVFSEIAEKTTVVSNPVKYLLKSWISSLVLLIVRFAVSPSACE